MKKMFALITLILACLVLTVGCKDNSDTSQYDVEIGDKLYIAQVTDVLANYDDYSGKTIKYEGIVNKYGDDPVYCYVIRYGPGCCGTDGEVGFQVRWDKNDEYPENGEWVEAVGTFGTYESPDGYTFKCVYLTSLEVLETRGVEFVYQ